MCECLRREDGTWHVDECCAWVMDELHDGKRLDENQIAADAFRIASDAADCMKKDFTPDTKEALSSWNRACHLVSLRLLSSADALIKKKQEVPF